MSRGLGKTQRQILTLLAEGSPMWVFDLVHQATGAEGNTSRTGFPVNHAVVFRRALARMQEQGLVRCSGYYPHRQGQPRDWEITDKGRALVEQWEREMRTLACMIVRADGSPRR